MLTDLEGDAELEALRSDLERVVAGGEHGMARSDFLFDHWPTQHSDKMPKRDARELMQLLEKLGYGIEPDPRFGGPPLARGMPVVAFRQARGSLTSAPSDEYVSAVLVLHLMALVATADGKVDVAEQAALEHHLEESLHLDDGERRRLSAHVRWLLESGPRFTGLKKKLEALDASTRRSVAEFATMMANADGHIDPGEIKALRRIYSMLGLDPDEVYAAVHDSRASLAPPPATEPVSVRPAAKARSGYKVPARPKMRADAAAPDAAVVDMDRVRQKLQETAQVSSLLSGIFAEEDEQPASAIRTQTAEAGAPVQPVLAGLDSAQTAFLRELQARVEWPQEQLEELADRHGVLLEGTLDAINDLAFERTDAPAVEWDEPVEVDVQVVKEMLHGIESSAA